MFISARRITALHLVAGSLALVAAGTVLFCAAPRIAARSHVASPSCPSGNCEASLSGMGAAATPSLWTSLIDTSPFPPRWRCGRWTPAHGWLHIAADIVIWLAYLAIPATLAYFTWRRPAVPFSGIMLLFVAFIFCCG